MTCFVMFCRTMIFCYAHWIPNMVKPFCRDRTGMFGPASQRGKNFWPSSWKCSPPLLRCPCHCYRLRKTQMNLTPKFDECIVQRCWMHHLVMEFDQTIPDHTGPWLVTVLPMFFSALNFVNSCFDSTSGLAQLDKSLFDFSDYTRVLWVYCLPCSINNGSKEKMMTLMTLFALHVLKCLGCNKEEIVDLPWTLLMHFFEFF